MNNLKELEDINKEKYQETILVIVAGMLLLYAYFQNSVFLYIAIGLALIGLISATLSKWITWGWYKLALGLGFVNSRILLSILFFIFLVPLAFLSRIFSGKKDSLSLKKKEEGSYFLELDKKYSKKDLDKMW